MGIGPSKSPIVTTIGLGTSNLGPNIYRDGGGGGTINGSHIVWYSDGIWTSGGPPTSEATSGNWRNFTSNSISIIIPPLSSPSSESQSDNEYDGGYHGFGHRKHVNDMLDFGDEIHGPTQQIPFFYDDGENDRTHGIWPNQNLVTLCGGNCAVGFPEVVGRDGPDGEPYLVYNTAVKIELQIPTGGELDGENATRAGVDGDNGDGEDVVLPRPVATRPVKELFAAGEPSYGSFCAFGPEKDGFIYLFAKITDVPSEDGFDGAKTRVRGHGRDPDGGGSGDGRNGLKLARVPEGLFHQKSQYQYWYGNGWMSEMPAYDDPAANVLNWTEPEGNKAYGPAYGDVFWSELSQSYVMLFQSGATVSDDNLYISYSTKLESGWTTPLPIWKIPRYPDGYSYSFHAYPGEDPCGRSIPISWNQFRGPGQFDVGWGVLDLPRTMSRHLMGVPGFGSGKSLDRRCLQL